MLEEVIPTHREELTKYQLINQSTNQYIIQSINKSIIYFMLYIYVCLDNNVPKPSKRKRTYPPSQKKPVLYRAICMIKPAPFYEITKK